MFCTARFIVESKKKNNNNETEKLRQLESTIQFYDIECESTFVLIETSVNCEETNMFAYFIGRSRESSRLSL